MPAGKRHAIPREAQQLSPVMKAITRLEKVCDEHRYSVQVKIRNDIRFKSRSGKRRDSMAGKISIGQRKNMVTYGSLSSSNSISKRRNILSPHSSRYFITGEFSRSIWVTTGRGRNS